MMNLKNMLIIIINKTKKYKNQIMKCKIQIQNIMSQKKKENQKKRKIECKKQNKKWQNYKKK